MDTRGLEVRAQVPTPKVGRISAHRFYIEISNPTMVRHSAYDQLLLNLSSVLGREQQS